MSPVVQSQPGQHSETSPQVKKGRDEWSKGEAQAQAEEEGEKERGRKGERETRERERGVT